MKISYQWLKELLPTLKASPQELADRLTLAGLEVESIVEQGSGLDGVVVGKVLEKNKHPNADRLNVCLVDDGQSKLQVVCGASNVEVGGVYPFAKIGACLPNGLVIKQSSIRSVESNGMLCSSTELGMAEKSEGLLTLAQNAVVGMGVKEHLGFDDVILELGITPNRGDCLSHWGVAYEVAALFGLSFTAAQINLTSETTKSPIKVTLNTAHCSRYVAASIQGVNVGPSKTEIAKRLESLGIRAVNNVVDATNYIMLLTGHPLHAFDAEAIQDNSLLIQDSVTSATFKTLDGKERILQKDDVLIADPKRCLAIAGVMGGENSEVKSQTTNLILEAASFDGDAIRKTSRRLGIISESSYRFERGVNEVSVLDSMNALIDLILKTAGGKLLGPCVDVYPKPSAPKSILLTKLRLDEYLGVSLEIDEVESILKKLRLNPKFKENGWQTSIPPQRFDLNIEEDLIEEIVRFRGFDSIDAILPRRPMVAASEPMARNISRNFKNYLVGQGYQEIINYSFISAADIESVGLKGAESIALANPLSEELAIMRPSLLPGLLKTAAKNKIHQPSGARYFELRPVYTLKGQYLNLGLLAVGDAYNPNWQNISQGATYFEMKGLFESLATLGFVKPRYMPLQKECEFFHPGQSNRVLFGQDEAGMLGSIHPTICAHYDLNQPVAYLELNIDLVAKYSKPKKAIISTFSDQPTVSRDMALVVPTELSFDSIETSILKKKINQLKSINLFDVYEGDKLKPGTKSLGLNLIYGDSNKSLTDQDVNEIHFKLVKELEQELGVVLR